MAVLAVYKLIMIPLPYRIGFIAALLILVGFGMVWGYNYIWQKGWNQHKLETQAEMAKTYKAYTATLIFRGEQHDTNQGIISKLRDDVGKLRLNKPSARCPSPDGTPADQDGAGRIFLERVDAAYSNFQQGLVRLAERCDTLNIAAIRSNP